MDNILTIFKEYGYKYPNYSYSIKYNNYLDLFTFRLFDNKLLEVYEYRLYTCELENAELDIVDCVLNELTQLANKENNNA